MASKDLPPSTTPFPKIFIHNQFLAKPQPPTPGTSLSNKVALITGGNTGLGYQAALQLLSLSLSHLILAVRSLPKGESAAATLRSLFPHAKISVWHLDMTSYPSIQSLAQRCLSDLPDSHLDIALLNAGIIKYHFTTVPSTGNEESLQVNYLSTWLLAILLLPVLKPSPTTSPDNSPGRLTIVSAALSLSAKFPERTQIPLLKSFSNPKLFTPDQTYNSTKLLSHFFLWTLSEQVSPKEVIINLADPAWCRSTNLAREVPFILKPAVKLFGLTTGRSPAVGASCFVDAMVNKGPESHGCFLMSWRIHPFAAVCYGEEGRVLRERIWGETMEELEFAGVRGILEEMDGGERLRSEEGERLKFSFVS